MDVINVLGAAFPWWLSPLETTKMSLIPWRSDDQRIQQSY